MDWLDLLAVQGTLLEFIKEFSEVQNKKLIHRNVFHFYMLIMNDQKEILSK